MGKNNQHIEQVARKGEGMKSNRKMIKCNMSFLILNHKKTARPPPIHTLTHTDTHTPTHTHTHPVYV